MSMSTLVLVVIGAGLLVLGRKLFWFFVGAAGFLAGWTIATHYLPPEQAPTIILVAGIAGVLGILVALFLQKVAVLVGGALAGAYALTVGAALLGLDSSIHPLVPIVVGGIAGILLAKWVFDWGLIILSSAAGAVVIVHALDVSPSSASIATVLLFVLGAIIQIRMKGGWGKGGERKKKEEEKE
jgi:hypothetical protein